MSNKVKLFKSRFLKGAGIVSVLIVSLVLSACSAYMDAEPEFPDNDIYGLWTHSLTYWSSSKNDEAVSIVTNQYYEQVLSGIEAEIEELVKKIHSI